MDWWIVFVFYLDQFLFGESQKNAFNPQCVCQVLNKEVDLSWYEQPFRRSHLDQWMFCRIFKTANKSLAILLDQLETWSLPCSHKYSKFTVPHTLLNITNICIWCFFNFYSPNIYMFTELYTYFHTKSLARVSRNTLLVYFCLLLCIRWQDH